MSASRQISIRKTIPAGTEEVFLLHKISPPITLNLIPGDSGSGNVYYSVSPVSNINANTAYWAEWEQGEVTGVSIDSILSPVNAIKVSAINDDLIVELLA